MKKIPWICAIAIPALLLALPASTAVRRAALSAVKSFSIDGKRFLPDRQSHDCVSHIRNELKRQGLDVPDLGIATPTNRIFEEGLREAPVAFSTRKPSIPHGLRMEHILETETGTGRVELAFGSLESRGPEIRRRLSDSGWRCMEPVPGKTSVAVKNDRREAAIVLLDEKEGKFLQIRRME
ncbi:MAG: hypothetical protein HY896_13260 [Deltaproteobacteria bacterium]|nr:hypothetical protein [Deltaproteobacteria bacterium]